MKRPESFMRLMLLAAIAITVAACGRANQKDSLSISYEKYLMPNGLQVILHQDHSDPVISYAIMYHVGSSRRCRDVPDSPIFLNTSSSPDQKMFLQALLTGYLKRPADPTTALQTAM